MCIFDQFFQNLVDKSKSMLVYFHRIEKRKDPATKWLTESVFIQSNFMFENSYFYRQMWLNTSCLVISCRRIFEGGNVKACFFMRSGLSVNKQFLKKLFKSAMQKLSYERFCVGNAIV